MKSYKLIYLNLALLRNIIASSEATLIASMYLILIYKFIRSNERSITDLIYYSVKE